MVLDQEERFLRISNLDPKLDLARNPMIIHNLKAKVLVLHVPSLLTKWALRLESPTRTIIVVNFISQQQRSHFLFLIKIESKMCDLLDTSGSSVLFVANLSLLCDLMNPTMMSPQQRKMLPPSDSSLLPANILQNAYSSVAVISALLYQFNWILLFVHQWCKALHDLNRANAEGDVLLSMFLQSALSSLNPTICYGPRASSPLLTTSLVHYASSAYGYFKGLCSIVASSSKGNTPLAIFTDHSPCCGFFQIFVRHTQLPGS